MQKRLPPLNSLKAFEASAKHLSFTKAAEELYVTQAAISHQIKLLEDYLGFELFKRKNRTLELTELGGFYFYEVRTILNKLSEVTEQLCQRHLQTSITINVPQTFGAYWLVPHLSGFHQRYPDIEVHIIGVDEDEGMLNEDVDISIYYGKGNWKDLEVQLLYQGELLVLGSPHILPSHAFLSPEELKNHTLIHTHARDNWHSLINQLQLPEINLQHGPVFSHTSMAIQAATHGQGLVLANALLAQQELQAGHLRQALICPFVDPKAFYVVCDKRALNYPAVNAFRQWIMESIETINYA